MTMDPWTDRLSEYLDGELDATEAAACERHLAGCEECRALLADLRTVARQAVALPDRGPAHDLWPGIAAALAPDRTVVPLRPRRAWLGTAPRLAAAAVLVAVASGASVWLATHRTGSPGTPLPTVATGTPATRTPALIPASARAERTYDAAVSDLRAVLDAGRGRLDSTTVRVLERNLAIIDSAVADAQRAVAADPNNAYLNTYLAHTMRRKIDLLRQAASLASGQT